MKNLLVLLIILSLSACEKITDDIIESQFLDISIESINAPDDFNYSEVNSDLVVSIEVNNSHQLNQVWFNIVTTDGSESIADSVFMADDGNAQTSGDFIADDNIYSGKFTFTDETVAGEYLIEFYIKDNINYEPANLRKVGTHLFTYSTGEENEPPVLSDLNILDSVNREVSFIFSVMVNDPNGAGDISSVYYELYKPDGTLQVNSQGQSQFPMFDRGDLSGTGDQTADDGIYSFKLAFPVDVATGIWEFRFYAKDRSGALSNVITHNIEVN